MNLDYLDKLGEVRKSYFVVYLHDSRIISEVNYRDRTAVDITYNSFSATALEKLELIKAAVYAQLPLHLKDKTETKYIYIDTITDI